MFILIASVVCTCVPKCVEVGVLLFIGSSVFKVICPPINYQEIIHNRRKLSKTTRTNFTQILTRSEADNKFRGNLQFQYTGQIFTRNFRGQAPMKQWNPPNELQVTTPQKTAKPNFMDWEYFKFNLKAKMCTQIRCEFSNLLISRSSSFEEEKAKSVTFNKRARLLIILFLNAIYFWSHSTWYSSSSNVTIQTKLLHTYLRHFGKFNKFTMAIENQNCFSKGLKRDSFFSELYTTYLLD